MLLATAAVMPMLFTGCEKQSRMMSENGSGRANADGSISFTVSDGIRAAGSSQLTRAASDSLLLVCAESGDSLLLLRDISVSSQSGNTEQTRGTTVTGANIATLYSNSSYGGIGIKALCQGTGYFKDGERLMYASSAWQASETYYWPQDRNVSLDFWAWAPNIIPSGQGTVSNMQFGSSPKNLSFDYTIQTPDNTTMKDPVNQMDLLFAGRTDWKYGSDTDINGNVPFVFHHALSAVRIVIGKCNAGTLSRISITDVNSKGHCVFTPQPSSGNPYFVWSGQSTPKTYTIVTGLELEENLTGIPEIPVTEDAADARGTVFMLIPQAASGTRKLQLKFTPDVEGGTEKTYEAVLSDDWLPGMTYTYRLNLLGGIGVEVNATVTGNVESNAAITNVGKFKSYVRATIAANWYDAERNIIGPYDLGDIMSNPEFVKAANWSDYWAYNATEDIYYYRFPLDPDQTTECNLFDGFKATYNELYKTNKVRLTIVAQTVKRDEADGDPDYTATYKSRSSAYRAWGSDYTFLNE